MEKLFYYHYCMILLLSMSRSYFFLYWKSSFKICWQIHCTLYIYYTIIWKFHSYTVYMYIFFYFPICRMEEFLKNRGVEKNITDKMKEEGVSTVFKSEKNIWLSSTETIRQWKMSKKLLRNVLFSIIVVNWPPSSTTILLQMFSPHIWFLSFEDIEPFY